MGGWSDELVLVDENGSIYKDFNRIIRENIRNDWSEEIKEVNINFEKTYFLQNDGEKLSVRGVSFKYRFQIDKNFTISAP